MFPKHLPLDDPNRKKITASIRNRVKTGLKKILLPQDFTLMKKEWVRKTKTIRQGVYLRLSHVTFDILYGYCILDEYAHMIFPDPDEYYNDQIHKYWDLPLNIDDVPALVDKIVSEFESEGLAFLNKYKETDDLIRDFESKTVEDSIFAQSIDWRPYNIGISYANMNKKSKAIPYFQEMIDKWSSENIDWIKTRKKMCELWIEKLKK